MNDNILLSNYERVNWHGKKILIVELCVCRVCLNK